MSRPRRFRDLSLYWKFLLPFLGLLIVMGALGTFVIVRNLSERAQANVDQELHRRSFDAKIAIHDKELYLLESVNFASNIRGMADALHARDSRTLFALLQSVLALKQELGVLAVTDRTGIAVAEFDALASGAPRSRSGRDWRSAGIVREALRSKSGDRTAGFAGVGRTTLLAISGPVCSGAAECATAGVAIAGIDVSALAADALSRLGADSPRLSGASVALFDNEGRPLARAGDATAPARLTHEASRSKKVIAGDLETLFAPFEVQGRRAGTIAITVSRADAFSTVRGAAARLVAIMLATILGVVALLALLSRVILVQVRPLIDTNRALGGGDFSARVPVRSRDELGELARGVNSMAEQLQASHETLEARVAERTEEVRRLLEQRSEFFTALSHEFRTPLAVIISEADMLEDPKHRLSTAEVREAAKALRLSGKQLHDAINTILAIAEGEAGGLDMNLEDVRVQDVIKELRPSIEALTKSNGVDLSVNFPRAGLKVIADRGRLREVIINLVDNAAKYTPAGGAVELSAAQNNGSVLISVSDSGVGIPPGVGDRIFEPFYRVEGTKPPGGRASSGLGLALAKRLVEAQGGRLEYANRMEGGTIFTVSLESAKR